MVIMFIQFRENVISTQRSYFVVGTGFPGAGSILSTGRLGVLVVTLKYYQRWSLSSILFVMIFYFFICKRMPNKKDQLLRAPSRAGIYRYNSTRVEEGRTC